MRSNCSPYVPTPAFLSKAGFNGSLASCAIRNPLWRASWAQISIFPNRDQALFNLADRMDLPSLRSVVGTLSQSMRFGTPLAQSLRMAAAEMRTDRLMRVEERANRLPGMLTFPVMLLIMPTIFLIVGGPAVIKVMDTLNPH